MGRNSQNILAHELIGLKVRVVYASDPSLIGLEGRIVDETMHLLVIETEKGEKKVQKRVAVFEFILPMGERVVVDGALLEHRPEERTKKLWRVKGRTTA